MESGTIEFLAGIIKDHIISIIKKFKTPRAIDCMLSGRNIQLMSTMK
jgi:hypothetical protein